MAKKSKASKQRRMNLSKKKSRSKRNKRATESIAYESLEPKQLLAAVTVGNTTDVSNGDTSSLTALINDDGGDGISLREAIAATNSTSGEDTITFDTGLTGQTITLGGSQLVINDSVTIQGLGADQLTISGNDDSRIFLFGSVDAATYTIADITLTDGEVARGDEPSPQTGGAIALNNPGDTLIIQRSVISDSAANGGGAIIISGDGAELRISDSALINNEANFSGSAILTGGNVDVEIVNSTISGNASLNNLGALTVQTAGTQSGAMTLRNVTVANNTGNGLQTITGTNSTSTFTIGNSILADNGNANFAGGGSGAIFTSLGHNVFDDESVPTPMAGDQVNTDPLLEPLNDNGGPTPTHGLGLSSLAVNMGSNALAVDADGNALVNDQRGDGFARILFDTVDVGAFESSFEPFMELPSLVVTTTLDADDPTDSLTSLREAIDFANMTPGEDTITFNASVFTGGDNSVIRLTQGELVITDSLIIDGASASDVLITGDADDDDITVGDTNITDVSASFGETAGDDDDMLDDNSRVLNFSGSTGNLTLTNLTITGGRTIGDSEEGGGIRFDSDDALSLFNSTVSGNSTTGTAADGGGIYSNSGSVSLSNSTLSGNSSGDNGGGIYSFSGSVSLFNSTLSGNSSGDDGGGIRTSSGSVSLSNSTLSGNSSGDDGGGISSYSGSVSLSNSTLSGNSSGDDGGGIYTDDSTVLIVNSTITGNSASGQGGGISLYADNFNDDERLTLHNSIVAGNTDNGTAPDVLAVGDVVNDLIVENSLIGDTTGSGITSATGTGNILNQAALLGPLSDNGGPTQTHALLSGSPAIDAGNDLLAVDADMTALTTDQRGGDSDRIFDDPTAPGSSVDIGAFELHAVLVDNAIDEDDAVTSAGDVSLREAIGLVQADPTLDTITFAGDAFTSPNSVIRLTLGELEITNSLSIDGTSVGGVVITGDADDDDVTISGSNITDVSASFGETAGDDDDMLDDNSRVLRFSGSTGNLTLTNLTITGGRTTGGSASGGGIRFDSDGALSLFNSTLSGNSTTGTAADGGGIRTSSGSVSLSNSTVSGNSSGDNGGGIYSFSGSVSLSNSTLSGNSSGDDGGGIRTSSGSVSLSNSTLSGNSTTGTAADGGGIRTSSGSVSLSNSTVSGNSSGDDGGGIFSFSGSVSLSNSTLSGNSSDGDGGGIRTSSGSVSLSNSTLSGNSTAADGGGIFSTSGSVSLSNSTLSGNSSGDDGGGIYTDDSTVLILNSTITGNSASGQGGGISLYADNFNDDERLTLHNSIVAGNTDNGTAPDVLAVGDVVNDLIVENSLIGDTTGSGITSATGTGNILNQAALLGPLSDNGGPTQTHALLSGSPAIDAGNDLLAVDADDNPLLTDQRGVGFERIQDGGSGTATVDIGAFEFDDSFLLGDVNIDGEVNFLDISPFVSLLSNSEFLNEADTNRDGKVDFLDITPFVALLSSEANSPASSPSTAAATSSGSAAKFKAFVAEPDVVSEAPLVSVAEPEAQGPLVLVDDSLVSAVVAKSELAESETKVASATPIDTFIGPVAVATDRYRFLGDRISSSRGFEGDGPLVKRATLTGFAKRVDLSNDARDHQLSAKVSTERSFATAAELFDAQPESLDEVFDIEFDDALAGLV